MDCYQTELNEGSSLQVYCDSHFKEQIIRKDKPSSWEHSHAISTYLDNLQKISTQITPKYLAFFKGRLNFQKISFGNALVMRFICLINKKIKQGDYFKEQDVLEWSKHLVF